MLNKIGIATVFINLLISSAYPQAEWNLKAENDGIKVYTKTTAGSKFKSVKVVCDIEGRLSSIVAVIMDVRNNPAWVYKSKTCTVLKQVSPSDLYYYSEVSVPWPAQNRDFVAHLTARQNTQSKLVTIDDMGMADYLPEKQGLVRVKNSTGRWSLTPKLQGTVAIEYELTLDPGGNAPAWLLNLFVIDGPLKSIKALKGQVTKPKYRNAQLSYIINPL